VPPCGSHPPPATLTLGTRRRARCDIHHHRVCCGHHWLQASKGVPVVTPEQQDFFTTRRKIR
jgi:hypothetical protein